MVSGPNAGKVGAATFDKFATLVGNSGNDTFTFSGMGASLSGSIDGGLGLNKLVGDASANAWNISGANQGALNAIPFSNIPNLIGGAGTDTFTLTATGSIAGTLNGGAGSDILDLTALTSPITVDLQAKTAPGVAVLSGLARYNAPVTGGDTLRGLATANSFKLTGLNSGTLGAVSFNGFENLTGGAGNDSFTLLPGGSLSGGTISGGGGTNALTGANQSNTWNISGTGAGDVNGLPFSAIDNVNGGTANDVFNIAATGSLLGKLNARLGDNTLSYADWTSDVTINAAANTATALGAITGSSLSVLIGGAGNDTILSNGSRASVLIGGAGNDALTGSGQRDILLGGTGADNLVGGAGDDLLFGGTTGYESNVAALLALLAEWNGPSNYPTRLEHLRGTVAGGLNGTTILANSPIDTLIDDGEIDMLTGGLGRDFFIAGLNDLVVDRVISRTAAESIDNA